MRPRLSIALNQQFYDLTVLSESGTTKKGEILYLCRCKCGQEPLVSSTSLANGDSKSCGPDATTYLNALNKRNATTTSNEKWTIEQLQSGGYLAAGTVSGTPD